MVLNSVKVLTRYSSALSTSFTRPTYLKDDGTFEYDQHKSGEQGIIPILVQTPQSDTKDLKDEEWGYSMFGE